MAIRTHGHTPAREQFVERYSSFGEHGVGWVALGLTGSLLDPVADRRPRWRRGAAVVAGSYGLNQLL